MKVLLALGLLITLATSCPIDVEKFCKCEELHNGVKLDCSNTKGYDVVQILRQNQAMLGLVQELKMHRAGLTKLPASFFAGLYIKQLDLSFNEMTEIDQNAFQGMSPVLQEIFLHHNNLSKIPVGALTGINTLLRLDLSNNTIGDLGEADAFPNLPKLYDVNLGSNKICSVHSSIFQKIKNTIQTISFGHNCLKSVPASAIRGLTQLQAIHLLKNNIAQLEALNFMNLPVLNLLNLASNNISEINRQAFLNVPNMRYLYLTDNKISKIANGQFITFERIEMLDLTKNKIEKLQAGSFSQLPSLTRLYLGNNEINSIEKGAFSNSSIIILVLSNNKLQTLPEGVLDGLLNLQQVSFQHNQIKEIDQNAFYNAPSIALVDLSYNKIFDLPPSTFLAQLNLFMIDLSGNKLVRTPYAAFNRRVGTVMLKENPLVCTEKVHLIQDGIGTYVPSEPDLICGGKPTSTTSKPVHQIKLLPKHTTSEQVRPSGAFQQEGLISVQENTEETLQGKPELLPNRPERPDILNVRPVRIRGPSRSDIAHIESSPEIELAAGLATENNGESAAEEGNPSSNDEAISIPEDVSEPAPEIPSMEQSNVQEEVQAEPTMAPKVTTTLGQRLYTDIADNPRKIFPFPVPFLKQGPKMHQAQRINFSSTERTKLAHTLPPSIVIEPRPRPVNPNPELAGNSIEESNRIEKIAAPQSNTIPEKKERSKVSESRFSTGIIIVVSCISLAVLCMLVVFIALCFLRCRKGSRFTSSYSDSSVARTNAYVQSQAQMNMIYGTLGRERCVPMAHDEGHPWVYNPGPNYCNYYK